MSSNYNFFYNTPSLGGTGTVNAAPTPSGGGTTKCQTCQAALLLDNRDQHGNLWCVYCNSTNSSNNMNIGNLNLNNMNASQQLQLLQLQQQQQQQAPHNPAFNQHQPLPLTQPPTQTGGQNSYAAPYQQQPLNPLPRIPQQQQQLQQQQRQQGQPMHTTNAAFHPQQANLLQHSQLQPLHVALPPPMPDPAAFLGTGDVNTTVVDLPGLGTNNNTDNSSNRGRKRQVQDEDDDHEEDEDEEDEDDDDEDELREDDLPPPPPRKKPGFRTPGARGGNSNGKTGGNEQGDNGAGSSTEPKKLSRRQRPPKTSITRTRYSNDFKMRVVSEIENNGYGTITDISRHYGVAEQTLRDWVKNKEKIQWAVQRRGNLKANPVDHLKYVTQALLKFMDDYYESGLAKEQPITAKMIAAKGQEIKKQVLEEDERNPYLTEGERKMTKRFTASLSWGKKWVRQYGRPKPTQVPKDLEDLSKEELVRLLRSVTSEKEALERGVDPLKAKGITTTTGAKVLVDPLSAPPGTNEAASPFAKKPPEILKKYNNSLALLPSPPKVKISSAFKVDQVKAKITDTLFALIKKKAHTWKGRPTTEMTEEIPTLEAARELFQGYPEINKTARSYRWQLTGDQIIEWLGCAKYVHPVKFEGKVVCTIGQPAYVYAFAGFDSMLAKFEQNNSTLTLKVKTFTAGTGNIPGSDEPVFLCNELMHDDD